MTVTSEPCASAVDPLKRERIRLRMPGGKKCSKIQLHLGDLRGSTSKCPSLCPICSSQSQICRQQITCSLGWSLGPATLSHHLLPWDAACPQFWLVMFFPSFGSILPTSAFHLIHHIRQISNATFSTQPSMIPTGRKLCPPHNSTAIRALDAFYPFAYNICMSLVFLTGLEGACRWGLFYSSSYLALPHMGYLCTRVILGSWMS